MTETDDRAAREKNKQRWSVVTHLFPWVIFFYFSVLKHTQIQIMHSDV